MNKKIKYILQVLCCLLSSFSIVIITTRTISFYQFYLQFILTVLVSFKKVQSKFNWCCKQIIMEFELFTTS